MCATEFIKKCLQLMSTTAAQKIMSVRGEFLPDKTKGTVLSGRISEKHFQPEQPENQDFPVIEFLY
jgi:hypothetical protein